MSSNETFIIAGLGTLTIVSDTEYTLEIDDNHIFCVKGYGTQNPEYFVRTSPPINTHSVRYFNFFEEIDEWSPEEIAVMINTAIDCYRINNGIENNNVNPSIRDYQRLGG